LVKGIGVLKESTAWDLTACYSQVPLILEPFREMITKLHGWAFEQRVENLKALEFHWQKPCELVGYLPVERASQVQVFENAYRPKLRPTE
jgi:hypothetical protein